MRKDPDGNLFQVIRVFPMAAQYLKYAVTVCDDGRFTMVSGPEVEIPIRVFLYLIATIIKPQVFKILPTEDVSDQEVQVRPAQVSQYPRSLEVRHSLQ